MSSWSVSVRSYDGPLDLLYFIVKDKNLDIRTVGIAEIADQYAAYLDGLRQQEVDLNEASDYLSMMTSLMLLKAAELRPREGAAAEEFGDFDFEEDGESIRQAIRLFGAYKEMAFGLREMEGVERDSFGRGFREKFGAESDEEIVGKEAGVYQLHKAFYKVMQANSSSFGAAVHTISLDYFPIEDAIQQVGNLLRKRGRSSFDELVGADPQPLVASTTFQALLEMVHDPKSSCPVVLRQLDMNGLLWAYRKRDNTEYFDEMASTASVEPPSYDTPLAGGLVEYIQKRVGEMASDKLGIDGLLQELTNRVLGGKNVTDADLDHLLGGGSLGTMPSEVAGEPEPAPTDEELLRAALDDEISSELNDGPRAEDAAGESAESAAGAEADSEEPADADSEDGSDEEPDDDDSDVSDEEGAVEAEGEDPDGESGESGENFDKFFE
ncbi:MAG: segregation/condensation protein A [Fibrobacterales bacterium]|nr:segregation/condensation protein A [Fibrobacterales bacterium]MBP5188163.1 segregation/condensation protein A [Fibrobacterales bacterium]